MNQNKTNQIVKFRDKILQTNISHYKSKQRNCSRMDCNENNFQIQIHIPYHSDENNQPLQNETTQIDYTDIN